jgi:hypothetical protein
MVAPCSGAGHPPEASPQAWARSPRPATCLTRGRGEHGRASSQLTEAIEGLRIYGRSAGLDGACGYAIEILSTLGLIEATAVLLGSVFDGELWSEPTQLQVTAN